MVRPNLSARRGWLKWGATEMLIAEGMVLFGRPLATVVDLKVS